MDLFSWNEDKVLKVYEFKNNYYLGHGVVVYKGYFTNCPRAEEYTFFFLEDEPNTFGGNWFWNLSL